MGDLPRPPHPRLAIRQSRTAPHLGIGVIIGPNFRVLDVLVIWTYYVRYIPELGQCLDEERIEEYGGVHDEIIPPPPPLVIVIVIVIIA